jgi:hypothetical protein
MKQPNKKGQPLAEAAEGRQRPKENDAQSSTSPTQSGERVSQGLSGVRRVARARKQEQFTALLHHVTANLLRESFDALKKNAAPGVDGVTWREYEMGPEDRLIDLDSRLHRGTLPPASENHQQKLSRGRNLYKGERPRQVSLPCGGFNGPGSRFFADRKTECRTC